MNQQLWDSSAQAWIDMLDKGHLNRTLLLDPVMLRLAGDVRGLRVCDVGCGEGRFCRMLAERGAEVTGVDPTRSLLNVAKERDPIGSYIEAFAEDLPFTSGCFDLVVSYLVLIDVPDFRSAIREMTRILKPGGQVLVASLNSFCTTREQAWEKDADGNPLYVPVDDYFEERPQRVAWAGIDIFNYHRPLEDYMQAFIVAGLRLTSYMEPRISEQDASEHPGMADGRRVPFFNVMQWRKD